MGGVLFARGPGAGVHRCCPGVPLSPLSRALRAAGEAMCERLWSRFSWPRDKPSDLFQDLSLLICKLVTVVPTSPGVERVWQDRISSSQPGARRHAYLLRRTGVCAAVIMIRAVPRNGWNVGSGVMRLWGQTTYIRFPCLSPPANSGDFSTSVCLSLLTSKMGVRLVLT